MHLRSLHGSGQFYVMKNISTWLLCDKVQNIYNASKILVGWWSDIFDYYIEIANDIVLYCILLLHNQKPLELNSI